jgi:hypothetical protein
MEKLFTYNIPDEIWIDNFSKNLTVTTTYKGPKTIYVLVDGESIISWSETDYEHYNKSTSKVVVLDAEEHPEIAYMLVDLPEEKLFEDEINSDGSVYQKIKNPHMHDYYELKYDETNSENPWKLVLKVKDRTVLDAGRVFSDLEIAENYKLNADFDENTTNILNEYISDAKQFLESIKTYCPWKYSEYNPPKGPEFPKVIRDAILKNTLEKPTE